MTLVAPEATGGALDVLAADQAAEQRAHGSQGRTDLSNLLLWAQSRGACRYRTNERPLPGPMGHLGDKADLTPSPLKESGSHGGGLTGETNDVVRSYGFALTEQASVTLLMPVETIAAPGCCRRSRELGSGAERNRTAVRNTGVDHLVRSRPDLVIVTAVVMESTGSWGGRTVLDTRGSPPWRCCPRVLKKREPRS